jgi:hypothetical protein
MKILPFEKLHMVSKWVALVSAVLVLIMQFAPILSQVGFNVLVCMLAGSVILERILHRVALNEAFESLGMKQ